MKQASIAPVNHRKLIDIPEATFRVLSVKAALAGLSLKKLIETLLEREAEDIDEVETYKWLSATRPEGKVPLSDKEQKEFEKQFRLGSNN